MKAYYNENDKFAAAWLRELIKQGAIAPGVVDERSITEVQASDLDGYAQCHFFAGIGGWSYALRLAGWPDVQPVWTGSCPCQPFSSSGWGNGESDPRHLWPVWRPLIKERKPPVVFGEQVASKAGLSWLDEVCLDMEESDYAVASADLCAAGIGAPHVRQRLWWIAAAADSNSLRRQGIWTAKAGAWDEQQFERLVQDQLQLALPTGRLRALADGVSGRLGRLRGYGNAIVPQVAAEFIAAYMDITQEPAA